MLLAWAKPLFQLCHTITQPDYFRFQSLISKYFSLSPPEFWAGADAERFLYKLPADRPCCGYRIPSGDRLKPRRPLAAAVYISAVPTKLLRLVRHLRRPCRLPSPAWAHQFGQLKISSHHTYPQASSHLLPGPFAPLRPPRSCSFASQRVMNPRTPRTVFRFAGLFRHHSRIFRNCCITSTAGYTPAHSWHCP